MKLFFLNKKFAIAIFFVLIFSTLSAQNYRNAIGVRLGLGSGLTFKTFLTNSSALEFIAAYQIEERGYGVTGLYEIHNYRAIGASHLALVYGLGAHCNFYPKGSQYKNRNEIIYPDNTLVIGVDGIFGIDYYVASLPINWGIDIKPMFDFVHPGFRFWDAAVSIRYVIN